MGHLLWARSFKSSPETAGITPRLTNAGTFSCGFGDNLWPHRGYFKQPHVSWVRVRPGTRLPGGYGSSALSARGLRGEGRPALGTVSSFPTDPLGEPGFYSAMGKNRKVCQGVVSCALSASAVRGGGTPLQHGRQDLHPAGPHRQRSSWGHGYLWHPSLSCLSVQGDFVP